MLPLINMRGGWCNCKQGYSGGSKGVMWHAMSGIPSFVGGFSFYKFATACGYYNNNHEFVVF